MDVFHCAEFGKLKYVHHSSDKFSGFQWATALSSEKADSMIIYLVEIMIITVISVQIKTDHVPEYVSSKTVFFILQHKVHYRHTTQSGDYRTSETSEEKGWIIMRK